ncbi:MAG: hypothetical protein HY034_01395 [Nitrospirae bacterium]|nr:hypothetical protein [Nitrospirota bacterium]
MIQLIQLNAMELNHYILGTALILLGIIELIAGYLNIRWWIFTPQERRILKEDGEDRVFMRRKIAGITGLAIGVLTILFGRF